jgi:UDP-glucose:glycoprotein glucosyltransferase
MSSLTSLGLTPEQALELVSHETILDAQREGGISEGVFDASDREEGGDVIIWWNDIENDQRYAAWSDNIQTVSMQEAMNHLHELMQTPVAAPTYASPRVP